MQRSQADAFVLSPPVTGTSFRLTVGVCLRLSTQACSASQAPCAAPWGVAAGVEAVATRSGRSPRVRRVVPATMAAILR